MPDGHRQRQPFVDDGPLGLPGPGHDGHDPVADREPADARPDLDHLAGQVETGNVGRRARRRRVLTGPLEDVGPRHAGRLHGDEHLFRAGPRIGLVRHSSRPSTMVTAFILLVPYLP